MKINEDCNISDSSSIVTAYKSIFSSDAPFHVRVSVIIARIKEGKYSEIIDHIRKEDDKDKISELKKQLPCVCFAGKFTHRSIDGFVAGSGLAAIDIDNVRGAFKMKHDIAEHKSCYAAWLSPSGRGVHALFRIPNEITPAAYKDIYAAITQELTTLGIKPDTACSDISRAFFISYDNDIYINENAEVFDNYLPQLDVELEYDDNDVGDEGFEAREKIIVSHFLSKYGVPQEGQRNHYMFILACMLNRGGFDKEKIFEICSEYSNGLPDKELRTLVENVCSRYVSEFNTLRFKKRKKISRDLFMLQVAHELGYRKIEINGASNVPVRIGKFIKVMDEDKFNSDFKNNFLIGQNGKYEVKQGFEEIVKSDFNRKFISALKSIDYKPLYDDKDNAFFPFSDRIVIANNEGIHVKDFFDISTPLLFDDIIRPCNINDYIFTPTTEFGVWKDFIERIAGENLEQFKLAIGYLLHSYNPEPLRKVVIFTDETGDDDDPRGGTGKGLLMKGISFIRKMISIDMKIRGIKNNFSFSEFTHNTRIIKLDEAGAAFDMKDIFSIVTDGITIEKKYKSPFTINDETTPKITILTNAGVKGISTSYKRRRVDLRLKNFFNENNTPQSYYGRMFFYEWEKKDWDGFFSYMFLCAAYYIDSMKDFHAVKEVDLSEKEISLNLGKKFFEFIDEYVQGKEIIYIKDLERDYVDETSDKRVTKTLLTRKLRTYFEMKRIPFTIKRNNIGGKYFIIENSKPNKNENENEDKKGNDFPF